MKKTSLLMIFLVIAIMFTSIPIKAEGSLVDGEEIPLDGRTFIKNYRTFVTLNFIAEGLGEEVEWDAKNQIAIIGSFKGQEKIDNTFLYTNEENGYTLNLPNSWKEEAIIETRDGDLYVYEKNQLRSL